MGGEHDHESDRDLDPPGVEHRERGDDIVHAGGDRHRDGEDVVDDEGTCSHERGALSELVLRDGIRAAATGIGVDRLSVGRDDDREQCDDREPDVRRPGQRGGAAENEDQQDLVGRIGD